MVFIFVFRYFFCGIKFIFSTIISLIKWFGIGLITIILIFPYYFVTGIYYATSKKRRESVGMFKPLIPTIMMILSLATYFISIFIFTRWFVQNERIKNMSSSIIEATVILERDEPDEVVEETEEEEVIVENSQNNNNLIYSNTDFIDADFNTLLSRNSDTVAWILVNGTKINYPVVQTEDNDYYLYHDFNDNSTDVGWIFGDYRDNFDNFGRNTIIYGHNLINKTMFGTLTNILNSSWYNDYNNHYVKLSTPNAKTLWKVFSVYKIDPVVDYLKTGFNTDDDYYKWLIMLKERSKYNFGEEITYDDKIITLSTCDDTGTKRVVLHAKLINIEYK